MDQDQEIKEIVIARLESLPDNVNISVGSDGDQLNRQEMIDAVTRGDEIGKKIVEVQMNFLRSIKNGILNDQAPSAHSA